MELQKKKHPRELGNGHHEAESTAHCLLRSLHESPITVDSSQPFYVTTHAKEKRERSKREARESRRERSERAREVSCFALSILSVGSTIK